MLTINAYSPQVLGLQAKRCPNYYVPTKEAFIHFGQLHQSKLLNVKNGWRLIGLLSLYLFFGTAPTAFAIIRPPACVAQYSKENVMTSLEDIEARWKALYEEIKPYGTTLDAPLAETSLFTMDDKKSGIVKKTNELIKQMECVTENLERSGLMDDLSDETLEQQDAYRVEAARFQELAQNYRLFNFVALAISALALCASLWQVVNKSEWNKPPLIRRSRERN